MLPINNITVFVQNEVLAKEPSTRNTRHGGVPLSPLVGISLNVVATELERTGFVARPIGYINSDVDTFVLGGYLEIAPENGNLGRWAFTQRMADYDTTQTHTLEDVDALVADILKCKEALAFIDKTLPKHLLPPQANNQKT